MGPHSRLAANSDTLDALVPINRIVAEASYLALVSRMDKKSDRDEAKEDLDMARRRWPIWDPGKPFKPILSGKRGRNLRRRAAYGPWATQ